MGGATGIGATTALGFPGAICGANIEDLDLEEFLNGLADLDLVGAPIHLKGVGIFVLLEKGGLLGHANGVYDLINVSHGLVGLSGAAREGLKGIVEKDDGVVIKDFLDVHIFGGL